MSLLSEFVDRNTKDLQKLGGGGGKSSGYGGGGFKFRPIEISIPDNLDSWTFNVPTPNLDQDLMDPVEDVVNQVAPTVESVVNTVTDVADTTSNVVQDIVNMDLSPPDYRDAPVPDLMPVVNDALLAASSAVQPVFDLTKIDYARDFNELLDNANELVGTTLLETGKALEGIPATLSALSPYGSAGSGSSGGGGGAQLDANAPNLGDDKVFSDLETATGKGSQMSEEERLRRIRRLLTNRYGREKTILGGPGDTTSRRRYAV